MESFSYDNRLVQFVAEAVDVNFNDDPEWDFEAPFSDVTAHHYEAFFPGPCSAYQFSVLGDRRHGYFIWQFFFPLIMIVVASWIVFWISDFGNQLSTAFTLLLTVVAFNFYVATLLPRLLYNTFIEVCIFGYVNIFMTILIVVIQHQLLERKRSVSVFQFMRFSRVLFPVGNVLSVYWLKLDFLG